MATRYVRDTSGFSEAEPSDALDRAHALLARRLRSGSPVLTSPALTREFLGVHLGARDLELFSALHLDNILYVSFKVVSTQRLQDFACEGDPAMTIKTAPASNAPVKDSSLSASNRRALQSGVAYAITASSWLSPRRKPSSHTRLPT